MAYPSEGVGTLPMSPEHANKLGYYSIFAYVNMVARSHGIQSVYATNLYGKRDAGSHNQKLQTTLTTLDLQPNIWWNDESIREDDVASIVGSSICKKAISEEEVEITRCSCGQVEFPSSSKLYGRRKTLIRGKFSLCCNTELLSSVRKSLLTIEIGNVPNPKVSPAWAGSELRHQLVALKGRKLQVSRTSPRRFSFQNKDEKVFHLDNDLLWWLYPRWANDAGVSLNHLVVGASVVRQVAVLLAVADIFEIQPPKNLTFLPKVLFEPVHGVDTIQAAITRFGSSRVINALIRCAKSARKEIVLQGSLFPQMSNTLFAEI
jgi:hypothetical protein